MVRIYMISEYYSCEIQMRHRGLCAPATTLVELAKAS